MSFVSKFRKANSKLASGSVTAYLSTIKRLSKLAKNSTDYPENGKWLSKKGLYKAVLQLPLTTRKTLALAAVKASKVYGHVVPTWEKLMRASTRAHEKIRDARQKTTREKALWQDYASVYKAGVKLWAAASTKKADDWSQSDLRKAQQAYLLLLYGKHTPRLLETLKLPGHKGPNQLVKTKGGFKIVLADYKTKKSQGVREFKLDPVLTKPTAEFVKGALRLNQHGFVFTNARGMKLSKSSFSKLLTSATRAGGLKGVSAQLLRVFKSSANREVIMKARELENEMGHGSKESARYAKKA